VQKLLTVFLCSTLILFNNAPSLSQTTQQQTTTEKSGNKLFKADRLRHERELGLVIATGSVEMVEGDRVLRADTVSYNQKQDIVTATGNVVLMEPSGDVVFADHVELTGDFKDGIVQNIRILMVDEARMAAVGGRRVGGERTELHKAVYSPCRTCESKSGTPLWRIKAIDVVHNKAEQSIEYRDAFMEFFGIPVLYTPYLVHPDPTVKRRSGFLAPRYGSESVLGVILETPYYFNIAPDKDATIRPIITTNEGLVLAGEYRQRFVDAEAKLTGSATHGTKQSGEQGFRGHFFSDFRADLNNTWRAGADIRLTSDDTYLQRYDFTSDDTLTNRAFVEGFKGQNYASAQSYFWRGLRNEDDPGTTPLIAPILDFNAITPVGNGDARWVLDANLLSLTRSEGADSRRLSLINSWELPHVARTGEVYHLYASLQTDAYYASNVQEVGKATGDTSTGFTGRVFPRIGLDWRFPFSRADGSNTQILEPVAGIQFAPNGGNPGQISNEDSQDIEFDETNLFSRNRFTGLDRVEGGQRLYYGLRFGVFGSSGYSDGFIGQSYRFRRDNDFSATSGFNDHFSDIVGRVSVQPSTPVKLQYRFRLDKDDLSPRRNELSTVVGPKAIRLNLNYSFFDEGSGSGEFTDREEITYGFTSQITPAWSIDASTRRDLQASSTLNHNIGLTYECDCFTMKLTFTRTFTQDRDVRPSDTIFVRLIFKNLGEIQSGN
jgi:LPS-assembly protein